MRRFIFLILFLFFFFSANHAYAANFTTDYNVSYTINSDAKTHVNFNVTLTNTSEQYYASSYDIHVGFPTIVNVSASDPDGPITPNVTKTTKGENIELNFNKKVVGLGNKLNFNLAFDTGDVAQSTGNVWEINIPGLSNQSDFSSFNVSVSYPSFLGKPGSIKPDNSNMIERVSGNRINFSKSDLGTSGISIAFGSYQIYSFNLTYHLENTNLFPVRTEIALPPQTNYQDIEISAVEPKPLNVVKDADGNWLAQYRLSPSQKINVIATGKSRAYLNPRVEKVDSKTLSNYLQSQKYWDVDNPKIKSLATQLKTASAIYEYVVDNLSYDFSRVTSNKGRSGALGVLQDPSSAVCLEFTDLYVALARSAGIPAREMDGFANTKNTSERPLSLVKDVLHAWPEYYDSSKQKWIMVDPTWGNTTNGIDYFNTLDFDHFAFVIKGVDSTYPVPAGGYKTASDLSSRDVEVTVSQNFTSSPSLKLEVQLPAKSFPGLPILGKTIIKNTGTSISEKGTLKIDSVYLSPLQKNISVDGIPPYGYVEIPISFAKTSILTNRSDIITIAFGKNIYQQRILISPLVAGNFLIGGALIVLLTFISIIVFRSGRLSFFRRKR